MERSDGGGNDEASTLVARMKDRIVTDMTRPKPSQRNGRVTNLARSFLGWCNNHPIPAAVALIFGACIALLSVAQGTDWVIGKVWPPTPRIIEFDEKREAGGNFSVTIENPTDSAMVVTEAVFRATLPPTQMNANAAELLIPAATYDVPLDCAPGVTKVKLNPPFKVTAKEVGAVVFRFTVPMRPCQLFISLETTQGRTKEQEGLSLYQWRRKAP